jgi:TPP-dependent indolepyruvate ferredoxin oxidoreductase alpha subunit
VAPEHVHLVHAHPTKVDELAAILRRELEHPGLSVVIGVRECIVAARHRKARERAARVECAPEGGSGADAAGRGAEVAGSAASAADGEGGGR